jgi:hypothetical protein
VGDRRADQVEPHTYQQSNNTRNGLEMLMFHPGKKLSSKFRMKFAKLRFSIGNEKR